MVLILFIFVSCHRSDVLSLLCFIFLILAFIDIMETILDELPETRTDAARDFSLTCGGYCCAVVMYATEVVSIVIVMVCMEWRQEIAIVYMKLVSFLVCHTVAPDIACLLILHNCGVDHEFSWYRIFPSYPGLNLSLFLTFLFLPFLPY
jgi:hypothetical protein